MISQLFHHLPLFLVSLADKSVEQIGQQASNGLRSNYLEFAQWTTGHLGILGTMIVASLLALYGAATTRFVARRIRNWPFPLRTAVFVLLAGFGFGIMIATGSVWVAKLLALAGTTYLPPVVLAVFMVIGILAERSGRI